MCESGQVCVRVYAWLDLQEDASYATEQLHSLLGFILDDGVIGPHSQNVVLQEKRGREGEMEIENGSKRKELREKVLREEWKANISIGIS